MLQSLNFDLGNYRATLQCTWKLFRRFPE